MVVARLGDRYTMVNKFAVFVQCPAAVEVHGIHAWRKCGRKVAKGQRGLGILAPVTRRDKAVDDAPPTGGTPAEGAKEDGSPRRLKGYRVVYVWDISQTVPTDCPCPSLETCQCLYPATVPPQGPAADLGDIRELLEQLTGSDDDSAEPETASRPSEH
ncbi:hypothetical protein [Actinocorallia longicatena]|uniref:Uncharacterized protein n=1 Tax=Actinocorallia longicatena TaxID=111803 RepID=A0ABP6QN08_9ACTN